MARIEIRCLGTFQVSLDGAPVTGFESNRVRALLIYLAVEKDHPQRREALATLLWSDWSDTTALSNLRFTLSKLREAIGDRQADPPFLLINRESIQFNPACDHHLDVAAFEVGVTAARLQFNADGDRQGAIRSLETALELYRGDFLGGISLADSAPFDEWVGVQREHLHRLALQALDELAGWHEAAGELEQAVTCAYRQVELEPWLEEGHQQVMRLLALNGQRSQALAQYEVCRKVLGEQMQMEPSPETVRLFEAIRDGKLEELSAQPVKEEALPPAPGESPYMGMRYFDTADAGLFFGREALTRELSTRLASERFLAIVGASGSGKSSLVRAGLVPTFMKGIAMPGIPMPGIGMQGNRMPGGSLTGEVHIITPTAHPLESLAASLTRQSESVTATTTLMDDLLKDSRSLHLYAGKLLNLSGEAHLLLVVDQFEETFTACKDVNERKAFIDNLLTAASAESGGVLHIVITLRADFYHHCAEYEALRQALEKHQAYIGAMTHDELRQAIEAPALKEDWQFQPGLVDLILQDVGDEPGALPLLSHALLETWLRRQGRTLTLEGYAAAGGVRKAIAQTAESVYDHLAPAEQVIARGIFLRLTELGEGVQDTRRRVLLGELALAPEQQAAVDSVLKTLADARLVTTAQDSAEVAHEALIREWLRLRGWLDEDRAGLRLHRHLTENAQEWDRRGRDLSDLYSGARLSQAQEWAKQPGSRLNPLEQEFLDAALAAARSAETEREERRQRELAQARQLVKTQRQRSLLLAAGLGVAIILAGLSFWFNRQAQTNLVDAQARGTQAQANLIDSQKRGTQAQANLEDAHTSGTQAARNLQAAQDNAATAEAEQKRADTQSQLALARQLVAQARLIYGSASNALTQALLLAVQSMRTFPSFEAVQVLQKNTLTGEIARMTPKDWVLNIDISPNGKYIVSGNGDGTARVWDAFTGREISRMPHADWVNGTAFSPDSQYVVSGSFDKTVVIWEALTGKEIARMNHDDGGDGGVAYVAYSPDGKLVLSQNTTIRVWDILGKEIARLTTNIGFSCVAFSPDSRYVVTGTGAGGGTVTVWEIASGLEITHMIQNGSVTSCAFSPDGKYIVSGEGSNNTLTTTNDDTTARVWEAFSGKEIAHMTHGAIVNSVAFSPDGKFVVSGSDDKTARVWEALTGREIARITHDDGVGMVAFSPDGSYVGSVSYDNTALVWNAFTGREIARMTHDDAINEIAFSPDGKYVVSGSNDKTIRVWRTANEVDIPLATYDDFVYSTAFSPDSKYVVTGSTDKTARVWEAASGREIARMSHAKTVKSVAFSPDGVYVISGSDDTTARVWEAATGVEIARMTHDGGVTSLAFSPDGSYVVSGSADKTARVWEALTGKEIARMTFGDSVIQVAFSPDGKVVVSASWDNTVRIWEPASGKEIVRMTHAGDVNSVAFSLDGKLVVSGSDDKTARVWDAASGVEIARMTHSDDVLSVAFSPDGKLVISASRDKTARVWEARTGKEITHIIHDAVVDSVAFSPDGRYVVSGSWDHSATVWDWNAAAGVKITRIMHNGWVTSVAFSPDGRYVVSVGNDNTIEVWLGRPEDLMDKACKLLPRNLTRTEWALNIGDALPYQAVCPNLPLEEELAPTPTAIP